MTNAEIKTELDVVNKVYQLLSERVAGLEATIEVLIKRIAELEANFNLRVPMLTERMIALEKWQKAEQDKTRTGLRFS